MPTLKKRDEGRTKKSGQNNRAFYQSSRWHRLSLQFRKENPLCAECKKTGVIMHSQCVDHIVPIMEGGQMWDVTNLQALCTKHHNEKTARENKGWNRQDD